MSTPSYIGVIQIYITMRLSIFIIALLASVSISAQDVLQSFSIKGTKSSKWVVARISLDQCDNVVYEEQPDFQGVNVEVLNIDVLEPGLYEVIEYKNAKAMQVLGEYNQFFLDVEDGVVKKRIFRTSLDKLDTDKGTAVIIENYKITRRDISKVDA